MTETRHEPTVQTVLAREVKEGDRLVFGGRAVLTPVDDIDWNSNAHHGLLIIRYGTGVSVVGPNRPMKVLR